VQCLVQSDDLPRALLLPFVFPLTVVLCATKTGSSHQMANELLEKISKNCSDSEAAGLAEVTVVPTSTSEQYSEICATAELYYQLHW